MHTLKSSSDDCRLARNRGKYQSPSYSPHSEGGLRMPGVKKNALGRKKVGKAQRVGHLTLLQTTRELSGFSYNVAVASSTWFYQGP